MKLHLIAALTVLSFPGALISANEVRSYAPTDLLLSDHITCQSQIDSSCSITLFNPPQIRLRGAVAELNIADHTTHEMGINLVAWDDNSNDDYVCGPCAISEGAPSHLHCPDVTGKVCEGVWNSHSCVECPDTGCPHTGKECF